MKQNKNNNLLEKIKVLSTRYAKRNGFGIEIIQDFQKWNEKEGELVDENNLLEIYLLKGRKVYSDNIFKKCENHYHRIAGIAINPEGRFVHKGFEPDSAERRYSKDQEKFSDYIFQKVKTI